MHTAHAGFSFIAALQPGKCSDAKALLQQMNACPGNNPYIPFSQSGSTLFVSGIVVPAQDYHDEELPPALMLLTSFSGPLEAHLDELIRIGHQGLCTLLQYCADFPPEAFQSPAVLKAFLKAHRQKNYFYSGMHHITAADVACEEKLRQEIKTFVDDGQKAGLFQGLKSFEIREKIQKHIANHPDFGWAREPYKKNRLDWWYNTGKASLIRAIVGLVVILLLVSAIWTVVDLIRLWSHKVPALPATTRILIFPAVVLILFLAFLVFSILYIERGTHAVATMPAFERMKELDASQCHEVLNELTAVGVVKKGRLRRFVFRSILQVAPVLGSGTVIPTIATARWIAANGGKRLVFISNYANTASSYVRDFIDIKGSAQGINLLFGHGEGFPKTKWLRGGGAITNPEGFMSVFFQNQHVTPFWYCAFKNLSVDNITNNRAIRNGLVEPLTLDEIERWLKRL